MPKEGPTTAEINAVALRTAAEAQAKANAASAGRGVRMAKRKYNRFVLDPREIADPATSPSQAEIRMAVERTLRKSALDIFEKAEKAKSSGKKLSKRDQDRYDHFAKEYPYLIPERRKELQKRLERFIQPAEGIRAAGEGPTTEEVNEAARRVLAETGAKARTKKKQKLTPKEGPTTAEINAVALRTAAEAQAKANAARAGRGVRMAERKYNRFVLDPREIADPATSPSQAEIRLVVERTLRKSAIEIFEKAEKAKADGKKLSERDQTTYDLSIIIINPGLDSRARTALEHMLESVVSARGKVLRTNFSATSRVTRATKLTQAASRHSYRWCSPPTRCLGA